MTVRAVILWVHVLCGVVWVGVCATFILAAAALAGEPKESMVLAVKITPQINRVCVPLAIAIPATGIGNLFFVALARGVFLPGEFIGILSAKVVLLAAMVFALSGAWRATLRLEKQLATPNFRSNEADVRRIVAFYGLIVTLGLVALGLGLWLSGT
jgi:uncharacterized membrane protein